MTDQNEAACKDCHGLGYVRYIYPRTSPVASHWFTAGARPCRRCDYHREVEMTDTMATLRAKKGGAE